ncbi:Hypothetical protein PORT_92 [Enterococcus phage Porthos]|uniref:Uncharacterized protein n=2 Tax=Enterococcus phage Porthos TaxID=2795670 RepID=A0ACB0DNZ2_9CAUD|nr:Hypothetical protein PORT_92 [Enterococcus phage Porthos]
MSKTINDIIEDFDSKVNVQEVSKSIEDEQVEPVQEEAVEAPETVKEGVESDKPEEQPVEAEEVKEDAKPESEPAESVEKSEPESEVAEEATEPEVEEVEKSDKESDEEEKKSSDKEDDKDDKKAKKDKEDKKEDKDKEDEDKEDVKKSDESEVSEPVEKSTISPQDILGGFEAVFKNLAGLVDVQKSLTDTITELKSEIVSLREAREAISIEPEEVNKSILLDKTSEVTVEGKAVGFVTKSVDVEPDVNSEQEDVVEVVVEGAEQQEEAPDKSDEEQLFDSIRGIRDELMSTYTRVASTGQAPRGELEEIRQLWGRIKSQDELAHAQAFIDKYK